MGYGYLWFRPRASPGFDGWIMLVREEFETEDQAIYWPIQVPKSVDHAVVYMSGLYTARVVDKTRVVFRPPALCSSTRERAHSRVLQWAPYEGAATSGSCSTGASATATSSLGRSAGCMASIDARTATRPSSAARLAPSVASARPGRRRPIGALEPFAACTFCQSHAHAH